MTQEERIAELEERVSALEENLLLVYDNLDKRLKSIKSRRVKPINWTKAGVITATIIGLVQIVVAIFAVIK
ncbi:MAG: hypothetical protein IJG37_09305 [Synergistaceae bacterium]|nr:hypothetical protein [Synergistaceae bacterium]MBQ4432140.1 hypothetical protein [Synergistaceae bacterium]MBQ7168438.1 hypothetical protein [Synergistaceae bacterium]